MFLKLYAIAVPIFFALDMTWLGLIAKNFYRPSNADVLAANASSFPAIELFPVTKVAASWDDAQTKFFADGAEFDKIYTGEK